MVEPPGRQQLERVSPELVGRDDALALAARRWAAAQLGTGHLLLVSGEAGIGKSRLLAEIGSMAGTEATATAFYRDSEAIGSLILSLADGLRRAGMTDAAARLRERLLRADEDVDPARRRRSLVGDLADILLSLDADPILLRLDDLHWADELSLEVIERIAPALGSGTTMIVGAYRADELGAREWRSRLLGRRLAEEVRLARLDAAQVLAMAEAITGRRPSSEQLESLVARSDGIPFHVEELIASGSSEEVPDTVAQSVGARVSGLDESTVNLLGAAAVIGRTFSPDLLAAATGAAPGEVDRALTAMVDAQLVVPDHDGFAFRHALVGDAVYEGIPPFRRRDLHAAVAAAAENAGFGAGYLSQHYERAQDASNAYRLALAGGRSAASVSAHRDAAELFRRAQRTAPSDLSVPERARLLAELAGELAAADDNIRAAAALQSAIELYRRDGDEGSAAQLVPRLMATRHLLGAPLRERVGLAVDALERLPAGAPPTAALLAAVAAANMLDRRLDASLDFGRRAEAAGPDTALRIDLAATIGAVLVFAGDGDQGWATLEGAIATGLDSGLEAETARAYRMLGSSASVLVEYPRASDGLARGLDYSAITERWNDHFYLLAHRAHVRWATGDWAGAEADASRAIADGHGITTRITALYVLGYIALGRGELDRARDFLDDALRLAESMAELQRVSPVLWGLAEAALLADDAIGATELCERAFELSAAVDDAAYLFPFVLTGTRALVGQHRTDDAHAWVARCAPLLELRAIAGTMPALDHARGLISLAEGQTGAARAALESAQDGWLASGRFWEGTFATLDLARCAIRSRRPADAARLVAEVRESAARVGSALLAGLADRIGASDDDSPLSARELEVAQLVAEGATNREIAERLVISPKTASAHLEHILAKLGVSRRAEVAAWVTRRRSMAP